MMFSANYFGFDDNVTKDGERTGDRIAAIPFQEMPDIPPHEFLAKQRRFKAVIDSEEKPLVAMCSLKSFLRRGLSLLIYFWRNVTTPSNPELLVQTMQVSILYCGSCTQFLKLCGVSRDTPGLG